MLPLDVQGRSSTDSTMSGFVNNNNNNKNNSNNNNNNNNNNNKTVQDALQIKRKAIKRLRGQKKKNRLYQQVKAIDYRQN